HVVSVLDPGAGSLLVEAAGTETGDGTGPVSGVGHVDQAGEEQRLTEAATAMVGQGAGRTEPAEAAVVAVVGGEGDRCTVGGEGGVDAGGFRGEGAGKLEDPGRREGVAGQGQDPLLVRPGHPPDLVAGSADPGG